MRIIDRYVIREVLWPFVIGLLVFTFMLIIPFLIEYAESFISKGVAIPVVLRIMATLLPQALALTIPMSLLLGLLVAFGRLSADREFVAMQACGVSLMRLMRPVGLLSVLAWAATSYVLLVAVPDANQRFREITFAVVAARAEGEVRPRVFFEDFPDVVLYVREVPASGGGWRDVFMVDSRPGQPPATYLARSGRVVIDRERRWLDPSGREMTGTVEMVLEDGARHTADAAGKYEVFQFRQLLLRLNPETVFPREGPTPGAREMSIPQLRARAAELEAQGIYPHSELFEIQKKFSIPFACLVFGLIGLALGASNRRDGKLASFVVGVGVIFIYYVLLWLGQSLVRGHVVPPWVAAWMPNIALGGLGLLLFRWRDRAGDRPLRIAALMRLIPTFRIPPLRLPMLGTLDRYVAATYARVAGLAAVSMAGIFYISTFLDLSDKVFRGQATWSMLAALLLVHHAAVHLLHRPVVGAARGAGHDRHPDQEQRAGRHEGVRHQPVSRRAADDRRRGHRRAACSFCWSRRSSGRPIAAPKRSGTCCAADRRRRSTCCCGDGSSAAAATSITSTTTIRGPSSSVA